jgi:hypothetical protein
MSFKVKNSQLSNETLGVLNQLIELDINASAAFKLTRIIKYISSIVEDKLKTEKKIYEKWVMRDETGNPIHPKDEQGNSITSSVSITDMNLFTKDMSDLLEIENEIPFDKLNFEDLNLQTAKIKDLIKVEFLFN